MIRSSFFSLSTNKLCYNKEKRAISKNTVKKLSDAIEGGYIKNRIII